MILRRLVDNLKQQHWTGVFIELVIVILGVFIGLQVDNWNQDRLERLQERDTLIELHGDIVQSIEGQDRDVRFLQEQLDDQAIILKSLDACAVDPKDEQRFERGISELGYVNPPRFYRRTVNEIAASGHTSIIRNPEIAGRLAQIVALVEWRAQGYESTARTAERYRAVIELRVRHDLSRAIPDKFIPDLHGGVDFDIARLCKDPSVASAVSAISYLTDERLEAYRPILAQYRAFLPLIEDELWRRWQVRLKPDFAK